MRIGKKCNPLTLGPCGKADPLIGGFPRLWGGLERESRLVELSDFADSVCLPDYYPRDEKARANAACGTESSVLANSASLYPFETSPTERHIPFAELCQGVRPGNEPGDLAEQLVRATMQ